jgi:hypothetical protein
LKLLSLALEAPKNIRRSFRSFPIIGDVIAVPNSSSKYDVLPQAHS